MVRFIGHFERIAIVSRTIGEWRNLLFRSHRQNSRFLDYVPSSTERSTELRSE
jgi:hypothetical protein